MDESLLCYVAVPYTPEVKDILNFLSVENVQYPAYVECKHGCAIFIYKSNLELEEIDQETEWVINIEDVPTVLAMYANKDFKGICEYLNNIPERPFDVYINSSFAST